MSPAPRVEVHCHVLPAMDDGAKDCGQARRILSLLAEQGIREVVSTPHFYAHRESAARFLARRSLAMEALRRSGETILPIHPGAEVRLEQGLSAVDELVQMAWGNRGFLLVELPCGEYKRWMSQEICNIAFRLKVVPVIAHLDRYLAWYSKAQIQEVLEIPDAVIQLNNQALFQSATLRFALQLLRGGRPVLMGSDAHNLTTRAPDHHRAWPVLASKLKEDKLQQLCGFAENLFAEQSNNDITTKE